ncbi:MAG: CrcB family protein [Liquorilactobacillus ghanensis]|uniref:fluoride efflux transporter FluC n=1 Tax=Liquorilactobacillus ghanensis TaxID=399370 RepID=UPI0039EAE7CF
MNQSKCLLSIAFFGAIGGCLRYFIGIAFPFMGTIVVNLLGCFLLGFLTFLWLNFHTVASWLSLGLGTGFVGSFTTFSGFCLDNVKLLLAHQMFTAAGYICLSVVGGWLAAKLGMTVGIYVGQRLQLGKDK